MTAEEATSWEWSPYQISVGIQELVERAREGLGPKLMMAVKETNRNFHSTERYLVWATNNILRAIDRQQEVVLVLLDLTHRRLTL